MLLEKNVAGWDVSIIQLSRKKRHMDRVALMVFWEKLDNSRIGFSSSTPCTATIRELTFPRSSAHLFLWRSECSATCWNSQPLARVNDRLGTSIEVLEAENQSLKLQLKTCECADYKGNNSLKIQHLEWLKLNLETLLAEQAVTGWDDRGNDETSHSRTRDDGAAANPGEGNHHETAVTTANMPTPAAARGKSSTTRCLLRGRRETLPQSRHSADQTMLCKLKRKFSFFRERTLQQRTKLTDQNRQNQTKQKLHVQCSLRLFHQNSQYATNKLDEIQLKSDILVVTETGFNNENLELCKIPNSQLAEAYCRQSSKGGGLLMGDLNVDAMDSNHPSTKRLACDLLKSFGLELLVKTSTRVTATTQSAMNNIITNIENMSVRGQHSYLGPLWPRGYHYWNTNNYTQLISSIFMLSMLNLSLPSLQDHNIAKNFHSTHFCFVTAPHSSKFTGIGILGILETQRLSTAQRHCLETQSVCYQHSSCMVVRFAARGDILFPRFCGRRSQLAFCG
ncbi:accessory factor associated with RNA polymerase II [Homalodisca vitripennis]|nr:accessory factor associated with RNA polymerase II [Homalodisca vitripennis]